ncbi:MAG: GNAT family N-acetyltransferase [Patescibacteria group bacterium]|nr:GNAT family N-acetyltransferase [Patescibacteria group bacterium]
MKPGKIVKKFTHEGKEIIFRYPKKSDAKEFLSMINSLVKEKAYLTTQKKFTLKQEKKWLNNIIKKIKRKNIVLILIEIDGKIKGNTNIEISEREAVAHVGKFGILLTKEIRGRGWAEKLAKEVIREAKNKLKIKMVKLNLFAPNKKALNLYKKLNFREIGRIKKSLKHYGRYRDEILMVKYL